MKKVLSACALVFCALLGFAPDADAAFSPETDYMEALIEAVERGDSAAGEEAQRRRAEKIEALGLDCPPLDFEELSLLSRLIESEAGSGWLDAEWKMAVGEVVLNRVASPEFPDTLREVIFQPGQYNGAVRNILPSRASVLAAKRLLEGERVLGDAAVVFQSNGRQGSGVALVLEDAALGKTYLCYSSHRELYAAS